MSSGCSCGSGCKCGDSCGCSRSLNLGYSEKTTTETIISGVATVKMNFEGSESEMKSEAGNGGCKCGSNCNCDPCNC